VVDAAREETRCVDGSRTRGGVRVGIYEVTIPSRKADAARFGPEKTARGLDVGFQSDIAIRFEVDGQKRLRRLIVTYKQDDRSNRFVATLDDYETPVQIEKPPTSKIYGPSVTDPSSTTSRQDGSEDLSTSPSS
jgi:hypothetical protein